MNTEIQNIETAAAPSIEAQPAAPATATPSRWDRLNQLVTDGTIVGVVVNKVAINRDNKQVGLHVTIEGTRAFLPGSEFPRGQRPNENMVGTTVQVKVLEVDSKVRGGRVVVSRKAAVAVEQHNFIASLTEGQEITGVVARTTDFGCFVNLGIVDGLLHVSQIPGRNGEKNIPAIGQELTLRVRKLDADKGEVGLTLFTETQNDRRPARTENTNQGPSRRRQVENVTRATAAFKTPKTEVAPKTPKAPSPPKARTATKKNPFSKSFTSFADFAADFAKNDAVSTPTETTPEVTAEAGATPTV